MLTEHHPAIIMSWCWHIILMTLGYPADDIFMLAGNVDELFVSLQHKGKEFNIVVGKFPAGWTWRAYAERWLAFLAELDNGTITMAQREQLYNEHSGPLDRVGLVTRLVLKGMACWPIPGGPTP